MGTEFAPAKVNLTLHVTGRRADGYHRLDSLVAFAGVGDRVTAAPAPALALAVTGPQSGALGAGDDNLVLRAARAFGPPAGAAITLEKRLPVASGLGGGSADAAAALRALAALWRVPLPDADAVLALGADVPVCLAGRSARMTGAGEGLSPVALPGGWLVLVNPGVGVPTGAVFAALDGAFGAPMPRALPRLAGVADLAAFLATMRNDLAAPAAALAPAIPRVTGALAAQPGCLVARMSGSGATCWGLFADPGRAAAAAAALRRAEPGWWVAPAPLLT